MATAQHLLRVKPDPRGRLAIGKAIDAVNRRLSTAISGFDVLMNDDGSLVLRPMVEVPAEGVIVLSPANWRLFTALLEESEPSPELVRLAQETAGDRVSPPTPPTPPTA